MVLRVLELALEPAENQAAHKSPVASVDSRNSFPADVLVDFGYFADSFLAVLIHSAVHSSLDFPADSAYPADSPSGFPADSADSPSDFPADSADSPSDFLTDSADSPSDFPADSVDPSPHFDNNFSDFPDIQSVFAPADKQSVSAPALFSHGNK